MSGTCQETTMLGRFPITSISLSRGTNKLNSLGEARTLSKTVRRHFLDTFGPFNLNITLQGHTLLLLDAPGLVEEDYQRAALGKNYDNWDFPSGGSMAFIKANAAGKHNIFFWYRDLIDYFPTGRSDKPVILFSHIPLFRPDSKSCGPLRERGTIRRGVGPGYQNTLGKQTTAFLIKTLRPSAVFR
jgi:ethanolamine phosphate phosphodiesterase